MTQIHSGELREAQRIDIRPYMTGVSELSDFFDAGNGSFEGYVPVTIVERDTYLPFKSERTEELVEDLRLTRERDGWGNGQDSPMLAAYITGEEIPSVEVYDGLHRQIANEVFQKRHGVENDRPLDIISAIGNTAIHFVTVKPMSRRDMLDKRLTNTRNHPELRFARGGLWSAQLWYLDDISKLAPTISPKQAFNLAERGNSEATRIGKNMGLDREVVEKITLWATQKADDWSVDPSTVYKWIHRAESTTPEIIAKVRNIGRGRSANGIVTEQMVSSLTSFMGEERLKPTHNIVIDFSLKNNLSSVQFSYVLAEIMDPAKVVDPSDIAEVRSFLNTIDIDTLNLSEVARTHRRIRRRTDIYSAGALAVASVGEAIDRVADSLDVRHERDYFVPDADQRKAAIEAAESLERQAEKALRLAEQARQSANGGVPVDKVHPRAIPASEFDPAKFKNVLSTRETEIMQLIADGHSREELCQKLYLSDMTIKSHLSRIYGKLGARDKTEAMVRAIQTGAVNIADKVATDDTLSRSAAIDIDGQSIRSSASSKSRELLASDVDVINEFTDKLRALSSVSKLRLSPSEIADLTRTYRTLESMKQRIAGLDPMFRAIMFKARASS
jgi:DNA-binding NarL/FixJ family response regulator